MFVTGNISSHFPRVLPVPPDLVQLVYFAATAGRGHSSSKNARAWPTVRCCCCAVAVFQTALFLTPLQWALSLTSSDFRQQMAALCSFRQKCSFLFYANKTKVTVFRHFCHQLRRAGPPPTPSLHTKFSLPRFWIKIHRYTVCKWRRRVYTWCSVSAMTALTAWNCWSAHFSCCEWVDGTGMALLT